MSAHAFPAPPKLPKLSQDILDWTDEGELPVNMGAGRTITIRTHEVLVAPDTPFFRFLSVFNKVALVLATLALIGTIGLSLYFSVLLLDNLRVVTAMQTQQSPGTSQVLPTR
jgi:hypothetical protein